MATIEQLYTNIAIALGKSANTDGGGATYAAPTAKDNLSLQITAVWRDQLVTALGKRPWGFAQKSIYVERLVGVDFSLPPDKIAYPLPADFLKFLFFTNTSNANNTIDYEVVKIKANNSNVYSNLILVPGDSTDIIGSSISPTALGITYIPNELAIEDLPQLFFEYVYLRIALFLEAAQSDNNSPAESSLSQRVQAAFSNALYEDRQNRADQLKYNLGAEIVDNIIDW